MSTSIYNTEYVNNDTNKNNSAIGFAFLSIFIILIISIIYIYVRKHFQTYVDDIAKLLNNSIPERGQVTDSQKPNEPKPKNKEILDDEELFNSIASRYLTNPK